MRLCLLLTIAFMISCRSVPGNTPEVAATAVVISRTTVPDTSYTLANPQVSLRPTHTLLPTITATLMSTFTLTPPPQTTVPPMLASIEPASLPFTPTEMPTEDMALILTPSPTAAATTTYWPTVTRQVLSPAESAGLVACTNRVVADDLLLVVTQQFPLPASYTPPDLVLLTDYFESSLTLGQSLYVRLIVVEPLQRMLAEMQAVGLRPSIISAYRSYQEQGLAWQWWASQYPDRVAIMSARAGYSEHQLGTTIDFGSPALNHLFHVDFANTTEGIWLANNAHRFGFTMSYPANSYDITGLKYEPWHYRYVGQEMAEYLTRSGQILTSWQVANLSPPCIP